MLWKHWPRLKSREHLWEILMERFGLQNFPTHNFAESCILQMFHRLRWRFHITLVSPALIKAALPVTFFSFGWNEFCSLCHSVTPKKGPSLHWSIIEPLAHFFKATSKLFSHFNTFTHEIQSTVCFIILQMWKLMPKEVTCLARSTKISTRTLFSLF